MSTLDPKNLSELLEVVRLEDLEPYERNAKEHPPEQVEKIKTSIEEYGYTVPIIVDEDNVVIAGHGRILALEQLGVEEVSAIRREDLSPEQVKAFRLADNRVAESSWDYGFLEEELLDLKEDDFDLDLTGFEEDELADILGEEETKIRDKAYYTDKIDAPIYEPTGPKPPVEDLYRDGRAEDLLQRIEEAEIEDEDLREFLRLTAYRHVVFDYEQIAEFYAHEDPEVQDLMEELTLVIIDFDQAVEQGFVNFVEETLGGIADEG